MDDIQRARNEIQSALAQSESGIIEMLPHWRKPVAKMLGDDPKEEPHKCSCSCRKLNAWFNGEDI